MTDNASNINDNSQQPKKVTSDGVSAEQHSIADQIAADRYKKSESAVQSGPGIRNRKFRSRGPLF